MYIKYELYRVKDQGLFNAEMIEWVLQEDKDLIEINDNDDLGGLGEAEFRAYMANPEVMPYLNIVWNKKEDNNES